LAARLGLPAIYSFRFYAASGGLMSYGIDQLELVRAAASYVDRILRGTNPGELPTQTAALQLRKQFGAKACELLIGDRSRFLEPIKLLDLVGSAETDDTPQFFARLLRLLAASFRHAPCLSDHVCEYAKVGEHDQGYHPDRLDPAGYVVTTEQVVKDRDQQPEPDDEHEYREGVGQEIAESETFCCEQHRRSSLSIGTS
jgi:hypothetical protein